MQSTKRDMLARVGIGTLYNDYASRYPLSSVSFFAPSALGTSIDCTLLDIGHLVFVKFVSFL